MTIISMPRRTLAKVVESIILIEEKLPMKQKNMAKYLPNNSDSDIWKQWWWRWAL